MRRWLREFNLRLTYALRDPWDLEGNRALLREIDAMYIHKREAE